MFYNTAFSKLKKTLFLKSEKIALFKNFKLVFKVKNENLYLI